MTYHDSHVKVRDDSHTRVMGGTVANTQKMNTPPHERKNQRPEGAHTTTDHPSTIRIHYHPIQQALT